MPKYLCLELTQGQFESQSFLREEIFVIEGLNPTDALEKASEKIDSDMITVTPFEKLSNTGFGWHKVKERLCGDDSFTTTYSFVFNPFSKEINTNVPK